MGFATGYRVMRREALDGFGKTLPAFTYRGELIYPDLEARACRVRIRQTAWRAGKLAACSDELNGQTRRRLLFRDAHRIEHECLLLLRVSNAGRSQRCGLHRGRRPKAFNEGREMAGGGAPNAQNCFLNKRLATKVPMQFVCASMK